MWRGSDAADISCCSPRFPTPPPRAVQRSRTHTKQQTNALPCPHLVHRRRVGVERHEVVFAERRHAVADRLEVVEHGGAVWLWCRDCVGMLLVFGRSSRSLLLSPSCLPLALPPHQAATRSPPGLMRRSREAEAARDRVAVDDPRDVRHRAAVVLDGARDGERGGLFFLRACGACACVGLLVF